MAQRGGQDTAFELSFWLHITDDGGAMPDEAVAAAHEQAVEQVMSDERLLGVLPDDLSQTLLDWVNAQVGQAAERSPNVYAFWSAVDAIRMQARTLADASADAGDDMAALLTRLRSAEAVADETSPRSTGIVQPTTPATVRAPTTVEQVAPAAAPAQSVPSAAGINPAPPRKPTSQPRGPVETPKRTRPPITTSLRSSFRRTYRRFRSLFRTGGSR
jgi:hypothetical protein